MDYKQLAEQILENVGGKENVSNVTHCATRLRFNLKDDTKADEEVLKNTQGIMGVVNKGGQFQVVIGNDVQRVYRPLLDLGGFREEKETAPSQEEPKRNWFIRILDTIAGIFTPIIPAITGAGILKAVMALLVAFHWIDTASQTYQFLSYFADAAFYFLPFLLAASAANKFKCNTYMAMSIAGCLLYPNFMQAVAAAKEAGTTLTFIGLPVSLVSYSSSVIPIILGIWFMSYVEVLADKVSPKPVRFFTKPLLTLLITAPVTLIVLGPLGNILGEAIAKGILALETRASWLVPFLVGTFTPLLVMTGMHYGLIPIGINNIATQQFDTVVGPGMLGSNIAQGGAAFAVALRAKNPSTKQMAASAGITAVCGITEPAMYGVSLRFRRPLYAAMLGGGIGGIFMGIMHVGRYTSGSPGLLALPGYIGTEGPRNIMMACIGAGISFVTAFVCSYLLGIKEETGTQEHVETKEVSGIEVTDDLEIADGMEETTNADDAVISSENLGMEVRIAAPIQGETIALSDVNDPTFAQEILGKGVAIRPQEGKVYAPFDGKVIMVFDTKHAMGLVSKNGVEILIHVGVDTVNMAGKGFQAKVSAGQQIRKGDLLLEFDIDQIRRAGYDTVTPVIVSNSADYAKIQADIGRNAAVGDTILHIVL